MFHLIFLFRTFSFLFAALFHHFIISLLPSFFSSLPSESLCFHHLHFFSFSFIYLFSTLFSSISFFFLFFSVQLNIDMCVPLSDSELLLNASSSPELNQFKRHPFVFTPAVLDSGVQTIYIKMTNKGNVSIIIQDFIV